MNINQLPAHQHRAKTGSDSRLGLETVNGLSKSKGESEGQYTIPVVNGREPLNIRTSISSTGGNQDINNMQPYTTVNYIVCINGLFPSRN